MASTRKTMHLPTDQVYDLWASTYDSDGNMLQAVDTHYLSTLMFPRFFDTLCQSLPPQTDDISSLKITDLGCGTGRASLALIRAFRASNNADSLVRLAEMKYQTIYLSGLDASRNMLKVATDNVPAFASVGDTHVINTQYQQFDVFNETASAPDEAHAMISTLVLEHLPLQIYFERAASLLRPGGVFLLTNMHADMGNATFPSSSSAAADQPAIPTAAGFIDASTNTKIRGTSYAHTIAGVTQSARDAGFDVVGRVEESKVEAWMLERDEKADEGPLLGPRGKKWLGINVWFGMILQRKL